MTAANWSGTMHGITGWRAANARRLLATSSVCGVLVVSFAADVATGPAMLPISAVLGPRRG